MMSDKKQEHDTSASVIGLAPSFEAFGMVMDFLSESDVFANFELSALARVVRRQLTDGHNLAGIRGAEIIGYAGWLHTDKTTGEAWMEDRAILKPLYGETADAAALTIFAASDKAITQRLIPGARELNTGKRVFFKRGYDGVVRPGRKNTVLNMTGSEPTS